MFLVDHEGSSQEFCCWFNADVIWKGGYTRSEPQVSHQAFRFSTSRKEVKHVLPEIKPTELSQEGQDAILSRLMV